MSEPAHPSGPPPAETGSEEDSSPLRAEDLTRRADELMASEPVRRAATHLRLHDDQTLADQVDITRIPAPPFGERARGDFFAERFRALGLEEVTRDEVGNVLAWRGRPGRRPLVVTAHLDTVFPPGTDVTVHEEGRRLVGPGISDDGRGLAALLALLRALDAGPLETRAPLLFVATVGEEGAGDLRGVRHLFRDGGPARECVGFVSLDGAGLSRIVTSALGARRYRIRVRGPGGHSWVDYGRPNPIHALGRLVHRATSLERAPAPAWSLTVARWSGGTSVNAIPEEAWVELEIRCQDPGELETLGGEVRRLAREATDEENRRATERTRGTEPAHLEIERIGDRPAGETSPDDPLVRAAVAATRALGVRPDFATSSTDANIPMSLGIPAITLGAGGEAGLAHTTREWYRNVRGPDGVVRALLTVLLAAGVEDR